MIIIKDKRGAIIEVAPPYYIDYIFEKVVIKKLGNKDHNEKVQVLGEYKNQGEAKLIVEEIFKVINESNVKTVINGLGEHLGHIPASKAIYTMPQE